MGNKSVVSNYMTKDIIKLSKEDSVDKFIDMLNETGHSGYPVCDNDKLIGYITSKEILLTDKDKISDIMLDDRPRIKKDYTIDKVSKIMIRHGYHELPVVLDNNKLVGIISNLDIIRSKIDRSDIEKVKKIMKTYERIYDVECVYSKEDLKLSDIEPTQLKVYSDEVKARRYEAKNDLIEPIIVGKTKNQCAVLDGHHRLVAAHMEDLESIEAWLIKIDKDNINITESRESVRSIEDVEIVDSIDN